MSRDLPVDQNHLLVQESHVVLAAAPSRRVCRLSPLPRCVLFRRESRHWSDIAAVKESQPTALKSPNPPTVSLNPIVAMWKSNLHALAQALGLTKLTEQVWQHENERVKRWRNEINSLLTFVSIRSTPQLLHSMALKCC